MTVPLLRSAITQGSYKAAPDQFGSTHVSNASPLVKSMGRESFSLAVEVPSNSIAPFDSSPISGKSDGSFSARAVVCNPSSRTNAEKPRVRFIKTFSHSHQILGSSSQRQYASTLSRNQRSIGRCVNIIECNVNRLIIAVSVAFGGYGLAILVRLTMAWRLASMQTQGFALEIGSAYFACQKAG